MKIEQLLSGFGLYLTKEEREFVNQYQTTKITSLNEHDRWLALNLVRKGAYTISNDSTTLVKNLK